MSPTSSQMQKVEPSRIVSWAMSGQIADRADGGRLVERLDDDLVHVHMRGTGDREDDAVGDVVRPQRLDASVDGRGLLLVAAKPDAGEVRFDEARIDGGQPDRPAEQILAQRVREAADRVFRGDVDGGVR